MQNTVSTILALVIAGLLIFVMPLITLTDRIDNVEQENAKLIVEEFVIDVKNTGKLTRARYQELENKLDSMGNNSYDIELEIQHLDENPGKKTAQTNYKKIGENVYYSEFTTQILKQIGIKADNEPIENQEAFSKNDTMLLKEGDIIKVEIKNTNSTASQKLKSSLIGFSNAGEYVISASASGMVTVNGVKD